MDYEATATMIWDSAIDNKSARRIVAMMQQMLHDGASDADVQQAIDEALAG